MDSLTHLVAGALTPIAFPYAPKRSALVAFGIVAGQFPDIDVLFGGASPEFFLSAHRGITHALVLQPIMALAVVFPFALLLLNQPARFPAWGGAAALSPVAGGAFAPHGGAGALQGEAGAHGPSRRFGLGSMVCAALLALYLHIFLDCMTTFGTQIFLPFSAARVGFPSMFIVDFLLTLPALALLCLVLWLPSVSAPAAVQGSWWRVLRSARTADENAPTPGLKYFSPRAQVLARIGLCWLVLYPLTALGLNGTLAYGYAKVWGNEPARVALLTEPFSPFLWKAVVDEGPVYRMGTLFPLAATPVREWVTFSKVDTELYSRLEAQEPLFTHFRKFSPTMVQITHQQRFTGKDGTRDTLAGSEVTVYRFSDMRYLISPQSPARFFGHGDANFQLEAQVAADGTLLAYRYLHRAREVETPWAYPTRTGN